MAEMKTRPTKVSPASFIAAVADPARRRDCRVVTAMMRKATGAKPTMWGPSIVGFGVRHYVYASGREGDWPIVGFSPRKGDLTLYCLTGSAEEKRLLKVLGRHKTGKSCLYIKRLEDVDTGVLERIIAESVKRDGACGQE